MSYKYRKTKKRKHFNTYKPRKHGDCVMVSHGYATHTLKEAKDCSYCKKVFEQFEKDRKSGKIERMLNEIQEGKA